MDRGKIFELNVKCIALCLTFSSSMDMNRIFYLRYWFAIKLNEVDLVFGDANLV